MIDNLRELSIYPLWKKFIPLEDEPISINDVDNYLNGLIEGMYGETTEAGVELAGKLNEMIENGIEPAEIFGELIAIEESLLT